MRVHSLGMSTHIGHEYMCWVRWARVHASAVLGYIQNINGELTIHYSLLSVHLQDSLFFVFFCFAILACKMCQVLSNVILCISVMQHSKNRRKENIFF